MALPPSQLLPPPIVIMPSVASATTITAPAATPSDAAAAASAAGGAAAASVPAAPPPDTDMGPLTFDDWLKRATNVLQGGKTTLTMGETAGVAARKDFGWLVLGGSILCFIAGWVNAFSIIAAHATVSHVTGSTTNAGMAMVRGDGDYVLYAFGIWACFVVGGSIAGIIIMKDTFAMGRGYGHAFLLISALLFWASAWVLHAPQNHGWLFLCAMGMGIQNGVTTRYSGNVVRTTHMTGLSTDIGITIGHVLRCHPKPERWKLKMYCPMLLFFFLGAAAGRAAYTACGRASLLFPAAFLFILGISYIYYLSRTRKQPFHKILLKRISREVLEPDSPSNFRKRLRSIQMPHMPQMPPMFTHSPRSNKAAKAAKKGHRQARSDTIDDVFGEDPDYLHASGTNADVV